MKKDNFIAVVISCNVYISKEMSFKACGLTAGVTGGWGEKGSKTENCQSFRKSQKNAQSPSRPVHAVLGAVFSSLFIILGNRSLETVALPNLSTRFGFHHIVGYKSHLATLSSNNAH